MTNIVMRFSKFYETNNMTQSVDILEIVLNGSKLHNMVHNIVHNIVQYFDEILTQHEMYGTKSENLAKWDIFCKLVDLQTVFDQSKYMNCLSNFPDVERMRFTEIFEFSYSAYLDIVRQNIPKFLIELKLEQIYEELVFFEYIYCSNLIDLTKKIEFMSIYRYDRLTKLLENNYLEICSETGLTDLDTFLDVSKNIFISNPCEKIFDTNQSIGIFNRLVCVHSSLLSFEPHYQKPINQSVKLCHMIMKNS